MLQQHLPFTVLKPKKISGRRPLYLKLQQHLPFTVLKRFTIRHNMKLISFWVATALTVYGIETIYLFIFPNLTNTLQQCVPFTVLKPISKVCAIEFWYVATVLTVYGIETLAPRKVHRLYYL